jgi:hypothetical protein
MREISKRSMGQNTVKEGVHLHLDILIMAIGSGKITLSMSVG